MPQITISAQLLKITRAIQPGQWLLIHPDEHYEVLNHEQAMALQGRRTVPNPQPRIRTVRVPEPAIANMTPPKSTSIMINGKTIKVEPQKLAVLQYMAAHGPLTVADVSTLLGGTKTSILSSLKMVGLVTSKPETQHAHSPFIYTLTNEGRAIATGVTL